MIYYRKGFKGQLYETVSFDTPIKPYDLIETDQIRLDINGKLTIQRFYAWDFASGPTFDTKNTIVPSLVHDAFCELIRLDLLTIIDARKRVDKHFYHLLKERKVWFLRARIWYRGVRWGAKHNPQKPRKVYIAS
jgi:hypothetical protein